MSKKKGLSLVDFAKVLMPEHRARPYSAAHIKDTFYLICLRREAKDGEGRWPWGMKGKQQMYIEVDADGLWRLLKEPAGIDVASFYGLGHEQSGK